MTGDTMKSELSMESKYRSEGRHSLPRRRVATKTSHCDGGDFEMELSLAIQESLKYAKEKERHLKRVDKKSPLLNGVTSDETFSRMAGKMLTASGDQGSGEIKQLKDLLLIHIELIQHQQELLGSKDKEIRTLRAEKDALQCRLEKAERRVSLMKQKEESLEAQATKDVADVATPAPPDKNRKVPPSKLEQQPTKRRKRRRGRLGLSKSQKPAKVQRRVQSDQKVSESESVTSSESGDSDAESGEEEGGQEEEGASDVDVEGSDGQVEEEEDSEKKMDEGGDEDGRDPHPDPVLRTDCMYHMSCCVELPPDEPIEMTEEKEVHTGEQVETPGWRIKMLTNRYQLEGTENITDEAYQKRHQKHEVEEKRRKRWDIQRMREQRVFEKLRGKEEQAARMSQEDKDVRTFLPCIDDLTHIEISDSIPVTAFGQAVPHIEPSEFELPWDTRPSASSSRKSHGGRGRQK